MEGTRAFIDKISDLSSDLIEARGHIGRLVGQRVGLLDAARDAVTRLQYAAWPEYDARRIAGEVRDNLQRVLDAIEQQDRAEFEGGGLQ